MKKRNILFKKKINVFYKKIKIFIVEQNPQITDNSKNTNPFLLEGKFFNQPAAPEIKNTAAQNNPDIRIINSTFPPAKLA